MIEHVVSAPYGRPAGKALGSAIAAAKAADGALSPVTVIVASNFAGLSARRLLGGGELGPAGVANVNFVTPFRLAELLASGRLGDRRPLTNPVLGAAVRRALADDPRHFAAVADHHATEAALASLTGELSNVSPAALARIERAGGSAASAVAFHRSIQSHLDGFHDEADVARAAAERVDLADVVAPFGSLIWYLPAPTTAPLSAFLEAVFRTAPTTAIVGIAGADDADQPVLGLCRRVGVEVDDRQPDPGSPAGPPTANRLVSVTDADEEVRALVRRIVGLVDAGVRLDRIGVFYPTPDPYVRMLEQQFSAADLPANGPSRRRLADTVAGRTLLSALAIPAQRWRRDRVMALISGAPLRHGDGPARPTAWETVSRVAGVVQGRADWIGKLQGRARQLATRLQELDSAEPGWKSERVREEQADVEALAGFIENLARSLDAFDHADGWSDKAVAAHALIESLLGPAHTHTGWPEPEQAAYEQIETVLTRLATLDEIEPTTTSAVFHRALSAELDVARNRNGRFGDGVVYGPIASAEGHDLDAVFILGCAEGLLPRSRRDDALLPDAARLLAGGELERKLGQLGDQHRQFLAALAAAPPDRRTLFFPRGDLRGGRHALPSRWLLDSATALVGRTVHATDFATLGPRFVEEVASHAAGLRESPIHGSVEERDLATIERHVKQGGQPHLHPTAAPVGRGLIVQAARRSDQFTEWDGNLAGEAIGSTADTPLSPTRLQTWAACGLRYFFSYVLDLGERDDPERTIEISPLDRGSGVHEILERFLQSVIDSGDVPAPHEGWSDAHRRQLAELAETVFDSYEARGRTGRPVRWQITKTDLLALLDEFLSADDRHRASTRSTPVRVELPFGLEGTEPVSLELPDGRVLRFRGKADRVDRSEDGTTYVSDYKTGSGSAYKGIDASDPVQAGTTLQLGLYAEAARQHLGADSVEAHYWMVNSKAGHARMGYPWDPERRERMLGVLATIADGIEGGVFPATPGEYDSWRSTHSACTYCEFDSVCPRDRGEQAEAKEDAPELRRRDGLLWVVEE